MRQLHFLGYIIEAYETRLPGGGRDFTVWTDILDPSQKAGWTVPIKRLSAPYNLHFRKNEAQEYGLSIGRKWIEEEIAAGNLAAKN
jgi:hypothetical protein